MSDIITELRERSLQAEQEGEPLALLDEAAAEIERLRGYRDEAEADAAVARLLADRLRLTDAEREAIRTAADAYAVRGAADGRESVNAATLRGLLDRTAKLSKTDNPDNFD